MDIQVDTRTAVVFDLDDTLYNEIDFLKSGYRHIARTLHPNSWERLYARMFSLYRNKLNTFDVISDEFNVNKEKLLTWYREHQPEISLFDGAYPLMERIRNKGGKLGMITDGRSLTQRNKIRALGISDLFDFVVISEEIGSEKPDKRNFDAIEQAFETANYYYIADNLRKDFITPNKHGWTTVGLLDNGMNIHSDSHLYLDAVHMPHYFISSLTDIRIT